jgi:uncharacterized membrane protein YfcA
MPPWRVDPGPLRDVLTAALGIGTGVLSGLFGVGGAVISTPGIRALGASAAIAVGTTLPSIIPGAASGTARYLREGLVDRRAVLATAPTGVAAAIAGAALTEIVPGDGHLLMLLTALLLGFSAWRMARTAPPASPVPPAPESDAEVADPAAVGTPDVGWRRYAAVGGIAGLLSGMLGIGGGVVMVPGFTQWAGMQVKQAIGTSLACVALFALPGTVTHALLGNIDWRFGLLLAVGVIPGARVGAALTIAADDRRLRLVVACFLGLTAALYAGGELAALN